jgi:hypothetical protein
MISFPFPINRVIHFTPVPNSDHSLPDPLASNSRRVLAPGAKSTASPFNRPSGVRHDVVARARVLAADPTYPSPAIIRQIAGQILIEADAVTPEI